MARLHLFSAVMLAIVAVAASADPEQVPQLHGITQVRSWDPDGRTGRE